ncbi:MAG TPA: hypothetical protein VG937_23425 [Polyangiaceae bacterium]|jgi:hypothetical protein|nr:hypothetical protein [Polyangiaceae bacterium]
MSYRIVDEPGPSGLSRLTVNPVWPFLASMLAGTWLAWPWFALNSACLGIDRRFYRDLILIGLSFAATLGATFALYQLYLNHVLDRTSLRYAALAPQAIRLSLLYVVYMREERTFQLFEYFGGRPANGLLPLMLGALLRGPLFSRLPESWILFFV